MINVMPERAAIRMVRIKAETINGCAELKIKVPGIAGVDMDSRIISGGSGWFTNPQSDDYVQIFLIDDDNILGGGAGAIVGTYVDTEVPMDNQGWYINPHKKYIDIRQIQMYGVLPAGLYLCIKAFTGDNRLDTFYASIKWGKR